MSIERDELIRQVSWKAKKAIRRYGVTFLVGMKTMEHAGVTVVWKNDYNDGVFKIILRHHLDYPPLHLVRERWVNGKTTKTYDKAHLVEGLNVVLYRLNQMMILDDLANV